MKLTFKSTDHSDLWIQSLTRQYDLLAAKEGFGRDQHYKHQLADNKVAAEWTGLPSQPEFTAFCHSRNSALMIKNLLFMIQGKMFSLTNFAV